ncbi:s-adenosyl-l-methionine-dependent methyltransferase [Lucifera butyrica]|uniref:S-adenosyl-l-methionine-dependent methyltransferase n=1 Tax=Lucifera butyrica TaxID=1351585 RepID=A0A498R171_9FIRM|nr:class I SAM-dependent methyltransferase [Lucifera butyrica]VBB05184.1 s-adenosyl-l-methionine-dependent methyltransferase [Lucifera butyrica]
MEKKCRFCGTPLKHTFADLGLSPLANCFIREADLNKKEYFYPLHAYVCEQCLLVQLEEIEAPERIFSEYAYFSSYSASWLDHARRYAAAMIRRFPLDKQSLVVEIASNDGYLLQYFQADGVPVLGIEPAANVAEVAAAKGILTLVRFFGTKLAAELAAQGIAADLLIGNNVLAHVPELNDFVAGMKMILKPHGLITMEFPHLLKLMQFNQFDTIYHEHFSYFTLRFVQNLLAAHGLKLFDAEELPTHGGSLRVFACHQEDALRTVSHSVPDLCRQEEEQGLASLETYRNFDEKIKKVKRDLLTFLIQIKEQDKTIAGYGAPAKGNTLLNYCGVRTDLLDYTVDRNPYKQGTYLPGTRIPVFSPERIGATRPDYVFILPWNLKTEIAAQLQEIRSWGGKFIVPIPEVQVF